MVVQGGYVSGRAATQLHVTKKNALATTKDRDKDRSPTPAAKLDRHADSHSGTPASATPPPAVSAAVVSHSHVTPPQVLSLSHSLLLVCPHRRLQSRALNIKYVKQKRDASATLANLVHNISWR